MGRSVETPSNAETVFYHRWDIEPDDYDLAPELFDDLKDTIFYNLQKVFPSLEQRGNSRHDWLPYPYDETQIIAENGHAFVTISEYCGLVAVSLVPIEHGCYMDGENELHSAWCAQVADKFNNTLAETFGGRLVKLASMSNGEGVYKHVGA